MPTRSRTLTLDSRQPHACGKAVTTPRDRWPAGRAVLAALLSVRSVPRVPPARHPRVGTHLTQLYRLVCSAAMWCGCWRLFPKPQNSPPRLCFAALSSACFASRPFIRPLIRPSQPTQQRARDARSDRIDTRQHDDQTHEFGRAEEGERRERQRRGEQATATERRDAADVRHVDSIERFLFHFVDSAFVGGGC